MADSPLITPHTPGCSFLGRGHSDAALRIADTVTLHWIAAEWDSIGKWAAFALADGRSPDNSPLYPTKLDAMRMQGANFLRYFYVCLVPGGMTVCEAETLLALHRRARARDIATPDMDAPNGGRDLIPRITAEGRIRQIRNLGGKA
jgi:hypothetical protein